ncbi:unnamed protein product [Prunus brigantina]
MRSRSGTSFTCEISIFLCMWNGMSFELTYIDTVWVWSKIQVEIRVKQLQVQVEPNSEVKAKSNSKSRQNPTPSLGGNPTARLAGLGLG